MADKFGGQKDGRQTTGATFYDVPAVPVNANALYFPNFPASPFFGVAEYPVAAGDLGAFSTSGVFVFDKPIGWIDNPGRKVFYRPKTAATGEIVAQEVKGDVFVGYQVIDNINPQKLGVLLASPEFCMNVLIVTSTADSGAGSLRQAIADAQDGDVILFDADVFPVGQTTSILLSSYLTVNKSVSIYGGFSDGNGGYTSGATITRYVIREVEGVETEVAVTDENPALEGEVVLMHVTTRVALDGQATQDPNAEGDWDGWSGSRVLACSAGGISVGLHGIELRNGLSAYTESGPLIYFTPSSDSSISIADCKLSGGVNAAGIAGGAVFRTQSIVNATRVEITNCRAKGSCGALYLVGSTISTLTDFCITDCSATSGGAVQTANTSQNNLTDCVISGCNASNGGGFYSLGASQNTLTDCSILNCSATSSGGGLRSTDTSKNTLNDCIFDSCSATTNGGAVYSLTSSQNTLNSCAIIGCTAANGGGLNAASTCHNTLTGCTFDGCNATQYGSAVYATSTSQNTLTDCAITGCLSGFSAAYFCGMTSVNTLNNCTMTGCSATANSGVGGIYIANTSSIDLDNCTVKNNTAPQTQRGNAMFDGAATIYGITTIGAATLNTATITIADGAALTITTSATIGAATFTSDGRGYLAVAPGIDISSATLTGVVACTYGAGLESFEISADGASWTADDLTTPILIETRDAGGDWQTLTNNATGGEYATTFALESTARAFDGVAFFVATLQGYWQADAGAVDANDWSVKGFAAANSNGGGDAQGDAAQGWTVTPSTVTPNADGV